MVNPNSSLLNQKHKHLTGFGSVTKYLTFFYGVLSVNRYYPIKFSEIKKWNGASTPLDAWDEAIEQSSRDYCHMTVIAFSFRRR